MATTIKLNKNAQGIVISITIDDKYKIKPDGKVYSPKFFHQELKEYPSHEVFSKEVKSLMKTLWKS
tara:strand:+ start:100 stop:297 length:198 start_codon:yes stop_codon:yes gene_type:complete